MRMIIVSWLLVIFIFLIFLLWNIDIIKFVYKIYFFSVSVLCVLLLFVFIFMGYFKIF